MTEHKEILVLDLSNVNNVDDILKKLNSIDSVSKEIRDVIAENRQTPKYKYIVNYVYENSGKSVILTDDEISYFSHTTDGVEMFNIFKELGVPELKDIQGSAQFSYATIDYQINEAITDDNTTLTILGDKITYRAKGIVSQKLPVSAQVVITRLPLQKADYEEAKNKELKIALGEILDKSNFNLEGKILTFKI